MVHEGIGQQEGECSELRTMCGDQDVWSERSTGIVGRMEKRRRA